jgi:chemotaxis protein MotB
MTQQNIIIKRVKKIQGGGHHGGAWKVAYADFVTAMMAFFLLMWLLNATTEDQRKGIADYFNPSIPIAAVSGGGADALNGESVTAETTLSKVSKETTDNPSQVVPTPDAGDVSETVAAALEKAMAGEAAELSEHISLRLTPEGLVIEVTDREEAPLFASGSAEPSRALIRLSAHIADVLSNVKNGIKITGHTDNLVFKNREGYSNWNLSTDRANTAYRLFMGAGKNEDRIREISGKAATEPLFENASDPRNRRISITILRNDLAAKE